MRNLELLDDRRCIRRDEDLLEVVYHEFLHRIWPKGRPRDDGKPAAGLDVADNGVFQARVVLVPVLEQRSQPAWRAREREQENQGEAAIAQKVTAALTCGAAHFHFPSHFPEESPGVVARQCLGTRGC